MYELLWGSLVGLFQLKYLLPLVIGTVVGVVGGALPGVTITMTIIIVLPFTFAYAATTDLTLTYIGLFLTALLTVGQFSFWGNYLPHGYPLHLRGTGESFAANIGGRMIGTSFAALTAFLAAQDFMPGEGPARTAYTAAIVGFGVYFANFILSFFLPEIDPEHMKE